MARLRRIVLYAVNGSGLGHVTRLMAVATWLRRMVTLVEGRPPEIFFLTSCEASDVISQGGFASFKIPSKTMARKALPDPLEYRRLAKHLIWHTLGVFSPDLLVVDTIPQGSFDELLQVLDGPFKKALIHRRVKAEYAARPIFQAALSLYDIVIVPHSGDEGALRDHPVVRCPEIVRLEPQELPPREEVLRDLAIPEGKRVIYISAGGGGDPGSEAALSRLVEALSPPEDLHLIIAAGPLYRGRRLGGPTITWFTGPEAAHCLTACDAAISAGGYNTFHELLLLRIPTLFFAQEKMADEQDRRIREAAERGACRVLVEGQDPLAALRDILQPEVRAPLAQACATIISENGAGPCAGHMLSLFYPPDQLAWARGLLSPRVASAIEALGDAAPAILGRWLPLLMPMGRALSLRGHPALEALLARLSPASAQEVTGALGLVEGNRGMEAFERHLLAFLALIKEGALEAETALGLVEVAMKKHPLSQEAQREGVPWACEILDTLTQLFTLTAPGLDQAEVIQLYRIFPRLLDADRRASFALFKDMLAHQAAQGASCTDLVRKIQALKLTHKRLEAHSLAPLLGRS